MKPAVQVPGGDDDLDAVPVNAGYVSDLQWVHGSPRGFIGRRRAPSLLPISLSARTPLTMGRKSIGVFFRIIIFQDLFEIVAPGGVSEEVILVFKTLVKNDMGHAV